MKHHCPQAQARLALTLFTGLALHTAGLAGDVAPRGAAIVTVTGERPSSLPTQIPATVESITAAEIETKINATDSEDALRYFPSLLVRKRYIGDYNHAVLSSRASGSGNSARSMVFADGILLSNFLGNGAGFTPRWGLVTPEEIERVDVLYGPFSATYAGNSVGAVVDYVTRMPKRFEAHVKLGAFGNRFDLYNSHGQHGGWQASASLGDRDGDLAWWFNLNRLDSHSQPLTFATKFTTATTTAPGTPVTGAVLGLDKSNTPWWLIGDATQYRTVQDHAKAKLAYDFGGDLRGQASLAWWLNKATAQSHSYLRREADGTPFYSGVARINGNNYNIVASDFGQSREQLTHLMQGLSLQRRSKALFDWEVALSRYVYQQDQQRTPSLAKPAADDGGAGRITDLQGTGWTSFALKGIWRPGAAHVWDIGMQQDTYRWRQRVDNLADWTGGERSSPVNGFQGDTRLQSVYAQDAWTLDAQWKTVIGLRAEKWAAYGGAKTTGSGAPVTFASREERWWSPKAALAFQANEAWALKLSTGRAVRAPTVGELFQGNGNADPVSNAALKPEKSWTTEFNNLYSTATHKLRLTLFHENTHDALYSQAIAGSTPLVNSVQNVEHIRTRGFEAALDSMDLLSPGLDLQASLTYADSKILANSSYVALPGDSLGRQQPRVPKWRASLLASYAFAGQGTLSLGARYGSRQFGTLNNSDSNGRAYQGFSPYFTTDMRLHWKFGKQWAAALGIDNLNNATYWNFHPYPQRSYSAELRFDL